MTGSHPMRVLLNCNVPFSLAHGGAQIQIERTREALLTEGVQVDWLRWWEDTQEADIIHFFARPSAFFVQLAHAAGRKVVVSELLTSQGSRTTLQRFPQRVIRKLDSHIGRRLGGKLGWTVYRDVDANIFLTPWELQIAGELYGVSASNSWVVPNGVEEVFFIQPGLPRVKEDYLVSTATITERKRVLELAEAAVEAKVPVWIIGKPYSDSDPYYQRFLAIHRRHPNIVRYEGPINDRAVLAEIYQKARGFVLLSTMESLSLSALEAAAGGCPLLLSDLPWARCTFNSSASYCPVSYSTPETASVLKRFFADADIHPIPAKPLRWKEVAVQLTDIYQKVLN